MPQIPNEDAAPAILSHDTGRRLDAIIRRHGGKPTDVESHAGRITLPAPKKGLSPDQEVLDLDLSPHRTA